MRIHKREGFAIKKALFPENISAGWLYFYVHFVTEVICFFSLTRIVGDSAWLWIVPFVYDALAFFPQSLIGRLSDRFPKLPIGIAGVVLLSAAGLLYEFDALPHSFIPLVILCIGNACTHVNGAEVTLRCSNGKLSHSAIFVGGGSFGVITGKLLAKSTLSFYPVILLTLTAIPFILLAEYSRREADRCDNPCEKFNYASNKVSPAVVIVIATLVVIVRGFMGYGIPTSWNKTTIQTIALFVTMGVGKALGGIIADAIGVRKTAILSSLCALPFLLFGDNHMYISLIGVMIFSMTMSITLALLVSVLQKSPGLAFGFTTIGLFLGTAPIFFFRFSTMTVSCIAIALLSALCTAGLCLITRKDGERIEHI